MRRPRLLFWIVFVSFCVTCAFATTVRAQDKSIQLRFATFFPPTHKLAVVTDEWCKEVEKRTGGRVKVRQYPGATLSPPAQTYDGVVQGIVDVGNIVLGYTMGKFPLTEVLDYPLGYPSSDVSTRLANEYFRKFRPKEFDEVQVMYFHGQAPGILHAKKPINKLEDLKGMKMRTFGSNAEFMKLLGGVPVAMPMTDVYDAISKGVADGLFCPYEALEGWKLGEVIKYTTENYKSAYTAIFVVAMNKKKWAAIKPEDQKIIEKINEEWIERQIKVWNEINESGKAFSLARGNKIIKLSPEEDARWASKAEPLFDAYVKKTKEKGLPGEEVLKFARDFIKKNSK